MAKLKPLSLMLAGCLLAGSVVPGSAFAQPWMDRDQDRGRDWQDRDGRDWDRRDRDRRGRDWRDRDRNWDRGRRWRERDPDCYFVRREFRNRYGELIVRRYRVCED